MKQDWTNVMRDKLLESAATPPEDLWSDISAHLDKDTSAPFRTSHRRRWAAAAACAAALLGGGIGIYMASTTPGTPTPTNYVAVTPAVQPTPLQPAVTGVCATPAAAVSRKPSPAPLKDANGTLPAKPDTLPLTTGTADITTAAAESESRDTIEAIARAAEQQLLAQAEQQAQEIERQMQEAVMLHRRKAISLNFYASNTSLLALQHNGGNTGNLYDEMSNSTIPNTPPPPETPLTPDSPLMTPDLPQPPAYLDPDYCDDPDKEQEEDTPATRAKSTADDDIITNAQHKLPIRYGVLLRFPLSKTLSIGTGVTYSCLSSTLTWHTSNSPYNAQQTLHYIGIPVSIDYNLPSYKRFSFYLTAGGLIEKCVYGKINATSTSYRECITEKPFQFSLFAGAGVQFTLWKPVAIYAEPLAAYYFDNRSPIANIYKDRPLNLDLRVGVRLTLK